MELYVSSISLSKLRFFVVVRVQLDHTILNPEITSLEMRGNNSYTNHPNYFKSSTAKILKQYVYDLTSCNKFGPIWRI